MDHAFSAPDLQISFPQLPHPNPTRDWPFQISQTEWSTSDALALWDHTQVAGGVSINRAVVMNFVCHVV